MGGYRLVELGFVTADLERSARFFERQMGTGPFEFYRDLELLNVRSYGVATPVPIDLAMAGRGDVVIELICPNDQMASPFNVEAEHPVSFNHWSAFVEDFEGEYAKLSSAYEEAFYAEVPDADGKSCARLAYFDCRAEGGAFFEIMEAGPPVLWGLYDRLLGGALSAERGPAGGGIRQNRGDR